MIGPQRLPQIAIALAAIAVVMVALAIHVRSTRDDAAAPAKPPVAAPAIDAPTLADPWAPSAPEPPDALVDDAVGSTACLPCDDACRVTCTCKDGATASQWECTNGCCVQPADACEKHCRGHRGVR